MNINKTLIALTISLQISFTAIASQTDIDQIEQAAGALNVSELKAISLQLDGYDKALAYYRTGLSANLTGNSEQAIISIDDAIELLEQLDSSLPNDIETKALLAQVYGYKVALEPMKGAYFGPKSNAKLAEAEALSPNNPRVLLVKGIGKLNTPPIFGGSSEAAYRAFDKAILAYANDKDSGYHWGYAETYTWRGLVHMQSGEMHKAKHDWQLALDINPDYGWAKMLLSQH